jgi:ribonuclease G
MSYEFLFSRIDGRQWMARREDGSVVELRVEQDDDEVHSGCIVKGRVSNVLPGIQAAFIDIGGDRSVFLHANDLPASDEARARIPIEERLREGHEVVVQVVREGRGEKRARASCNLTIPGRMLVLVPGITRNAVSRRIPDRDERARIQSILEELPVEDCGWIARTAAVGADRQRLECEAERMLEAWRELRARRDDSSAPSVLLREPDLLTEVLRDSPSEELEAIVVDDADDRQRALDFLQTVDPLAASKIRLHTGEVGLFEAEGIDAEVDRALRPRVWLKSGGYLIIEETEALVSVDVNTGKFLGKRDFETTVLRTNLEAAREIARQLRLRGLGGIIVVDLIDMRGREDRNEVLAAFEEELRKDPARTRVEGISELGLLQLTRKLARPGIAHQLTRPCRECKGRGRVRRGEDQ